MSSKSLAHPYGVGLSPPEVLYWLPFLNTDSNTAFKKGSIWSSRFAMRYSDGSACTPSFLSRPSLLRGSVVSGRVISSTCASLHFGFDPSGKGCFHHGLLLEKLYATLLIVGTPNRYTPRREPRALA